MVSKKREFSYRFSVKDAEKTEKSFIDVGTAAKKGLGQVETASDKTTNSLNKVRKSGKRLQTRVLSLTGSTGMLSQTFRRLAGTAVMGLLIRNTIQTALGFEKVKIGLETALGSSEAAEETFKFLAEQIDRVGLPLLETTDSFKKLAASARGTALEGQPVLDLFVGLTEAASVYRLSQEQVNGVFKAYTDSISKGFVQMEELKGQLGDRLPGALRLAAEGLNITTQQLVKLVETGKLTATKFLPAFTQALQKDVAGGVSKAADSAQASFHRINNSIDVLQNTFAEGGFLDATKEFVDLLTTFLKDDAVISGAQNLGEAFGVIAGAIRDPKAGFVEPLEVLALQDVISANTVKPGDVGARLDAAFINFFSGDDEQVTAREVANRLNKRNDALQNALFAQNQIVSQRNAKRKALEEEQLKNIRDAVATAEAIEKAKPTIASKEAEELLKKLRIDTNIVKAQGKLRAELETQRNIKEQIDKLDRAAAKEAKGNIEEIIVLTQRQKDEVSALVRAQARAVEEQKRQKEAIKVLEKISEAYADLTPAVDDNIAGLEKWRDDTLSVLDDTAEGYAEFAAMVEALYQDKVTKVQDESLEKSDGFFVGLERGMRKLQEDTNTIAEDIEGAYVKMAEGISDSLQELVETGSLDLNELRNLAADVLRDISQGLITRGIVNPLLDNATGAIGDFAKKAAGSAIGDTAGSTAASFISSLFLHDGGTVGSAGNKTKAVPAGLFSGAPKFHNGLFLRDDEFPAILQKGEKVIPKGGGGPSTIIINVTTQDAGSFLQNKGQITSAMFNEVARQSRRNG